MAGRVDPMVVPLAAGCRYEAACDLDGFADDAGAVPVGRCRVAAVFDGRAVTEDVTGGRYPRAGVGVRARPAGSLAREAGLPG